MTLGNNLLRIREEHGLTQQEFGQLVHVTRQTVSNWENGKSYPDLQSLIIISDRYGVSLDLLLKEDLEMVRRMDWERKVARKRKWMLIGIAVLVISFFSAHLTAGGALSCANFFYSPISALTLDYEFVRNDLQYGPLYRITENASYDGKVSNWYREFWFVNKRGPLYFASFAGAP